MQHIPISAVPSQVFYTVLAGQNCTLSLYWRQDFLYLNLVVDETIVCQGALCQNKADIVQSKSPLFKGSLHFFDADGDRPPHWELLGTRYHLFFVENTEPLPLALRY